MRRMADLVAWVLLNRGRLTADIEFNTYEEYFSLYPDPPKFLARIKFGSDQDVFTFLARFMDRVVEQKHEYGQLEVRGLDEFPGFSIEEINGRFPWRAPAKPENACGDRLTGWVEQWK